MDVAVLSLAIMYSDIVRSDSARLSSPEVKKNYFKENKRRKGTFEIPTLGEVYSRSEDRIMELNRDVQMTFSKLFFRIYY